MKIMLDPGHGGKDPGAVGQNGTRESDVALKIALKLRDKLRHNNIDVLMTRDTDTALGNTINADLDARSAMANSANTDYYISLHCNSANNRSARGIETYAIAPGGQAEKLANAVQRRLVIETEGR